MQGIKGVAAGLAHAIDVERFQVLANTLDLAAHALANAGTGRLYQQLVVDRRWAQAVSAYQQGQQLSSVFHVVVDLKPDADVAAVTQAVEAELARRFGISGLEEKAARPPKQSE